MTIYGPICLESLRTFTRHKRVEFESKGLTERSIWLSNHLPGFLKDLSKVDQKISIFAEFFRFGSLVVQCWEAQRISNYDMYVHSIKETLPYLFSFNRFNYQQSALEFLSDISLLGEYYVDLLRSGVMFETLAAQPGKQMSCGYVLEIYNKIIKQISPTIDSSGDAWLRNLPRLAFIRQILINASNTKLFANPENDPIHRKIVNLDNIAKLRWVLQRRNIFTVELNEFTFKQRDPLHFLTSVEIEKDFIDCYANGKCALTELVSNVVEYKPVGSIEFLRKRLNLKKIVPFKVKKKFKPKVKIPPTKAEKKTLASNYKIEEIPQSSYLMLSPDNGTTPYLGTNKSLSGKFILDKYAMKVESD